MRRLLAFCVVAAVLSLAAAQSSSNWGSIVDRLYRAAAAKNFDDIGQLFTESAVLRANGVEHRGRVAIVKYYSDLLTPMMSHSAFATSSFFASGNKVHFSSQAFYAKADPSMGECLAIVHSFERLVVDSAGKITFQRTEWEETQAQFEDDLKCEHNEKHHAHTRVQDLIVERSFERHRHVEALSLKRYVRLYSDNVTVVASTSDLDGSATSVRSGHEGLGNLVRAIFNQTSSASFAPCTPIYLREHATFSVSSFFGVTHTGCPLAFQVVSYNTFDRKGNITLTEQHLVGADAAQIGAILAKDCGRPKPVRAEGVEEEEEDELDEGEADSEGDEDELEEDPEHFDDGEDAEGAEDADLNDDTLDGLEQDLEAAEAADKDHDGL